MSPKKYNEVIEQGYNAVSVKVALHNQAIFLLVKGMKPEKIVIDAFTSSQNYQKYLKKEANQFPNPITTKKKAEGKYLAVAVSSIIARSMFFRKSCPAWSASWNATCRLERAVNPTSRSRSILKQYHWHGWSQWNCKLHFANTQKAQKLLK